MSPSALLRALRPRQWAKNVFVLAALAFALADRRVDGGVGREALVDTLLAFVAFCLASSAVYLLNDVRDVERDRAHPDKRTRPVAAGELSIPVALGVGLVLALTALALGAWIGGAPHSVAAVLALYMGINAAYSLGLKRIVFVDVFCIASGFLLRVEAGGLAAGAQVSHWMFLCTLFLALFLALNKRRAELMLLGEEGANHRASLREYSVAFLDQMVGVLAACTIVCYTMYTVVEDTKLKFGEGHGLLWTVPFVVFGVGRYMSIVQSGKGGGNPARILLGGDLLFLLNLLGWAAVVAYALFLRE